MKKTITIDGNNFSDIEGFYSEIDNTFTLNLSWETGHNLDALNDILRGGFGVTEYEEPIKLIWLNSEKSKKDLNKNKNGENFYNEVVEIIKNMKHIDFLAQ